jgi:hypothetical protein
MFWRSSDDCRDHIHVRARKLCCGRRVIVGLTRSRNVHRQCKL